ncbi:protein-disulfide reductase DsbD [Pasteurella oralis]|uniref:protein-disulfide reductase DsbD n=1 Tax=Pasteurella oralis TaxID=1071947 RepID=UPI000C79BD7D|nr:protein-disulfide reductase DsbD [Pasteurella oralis]
MKKIFSVLLLLSVALMAQASFFDKKPRFLSADQAFIFSSSQQAEMIELNWLIAENYYLYKQSFEINGINVGLGEIDFPAAEKYQDDFFGEVEIYRNDVTLQVPLSKINQHAQLQISYQGCTTGFCYPPETKVVDINPIFTANVLEKIETSPKSTALQPPVLAEQDRLAASLFQSKYAVFWFFLFGLGLAFTPCVLPMLPLLSAIVIGANQRPSTTRALGLSIVYVQGMALTYTLLGLIVAAIGLPFQVALQSPYVLVALAIIFTLLALSMFGLFTLQLPSRLQTKLTQYSQQQKSGAFSGVFVMGMIAGLVASPCTSAPLSGVLLYVAQSGDLFTGAITLYLLALGMGTPLILITVFGNKVLPKSGDWMIQVKNAFGFVLLALPVFLLSRVFPDIESHLWFSLAVGFVLWLLFQLRHRRWIWFVLFAALVLGKVYYFPLQSEVLGKSAVKKLEISQHVPFQSVTSYAQLQQVLQQNPKAMAMLDLYADWCVACKEFEKYTFSDPLVQKQFEHILLLQVDMTKNTEQNRELLQKLQVIGLPTLIFFDQQGNEIVGSRVTGFMQAAPFATWLQQIKP